MKTILIVDDHPDIRHLFSMLLKHEYVVKEAESGAEALQLIRKLHPSLVLMDVMMPGEVDGLQALKTIKQDPALQDTYVIMVTARGQAADLEYATNLGADAYFIKPFSPLSLIVHIRKALED
ncbi:MAG: response regulator [Gammaproteobacteria bacterium SHHR-1]